MSGQLDAFWRLTGRRVFARLGMRAITAAIKVGRLSRDSGRYLVGPVQLREQFEMGNVASLRRKNLRVGSSTPPSKLDASNTTSPPRNNRGRANEFAGPSMPHGRGFDLGFEAVSSPKSGSARRRTGRPRLRVRSL